MTRILIRAGRAPDQAITAEAAYAYHGVGTFSTNTGNLLFQDAVYRWLVQPGSELVVDSLTTERRGVSADHIDRINNEFDLVVLPLANAFREDFVKPLNRLTSVVEQLRLPVVVTGVGGQLPLDGDPRGASSDVDAASLGFVRAILERSESIGVRGDLTKGYLVHLGIPEDRIDVIGCPSLHVADPGAVAVKGPARLSAESRVAINLTPSVPAARALLEHNYRHYPHLTYLAQDTETLGLLLWGEEFPTAPGMPGSLDHYLCREDKIRVIIDPAPWLDFLAEHDFAFGTRIHGNVAALMAGRPAFVLAHDSRTVELCRFHHIPHLELPQDGSTDGVELDAAELYDRTDLAGFNQHRAPNQENWLKFLDRNHVPHGAQLDPAFEAKLAQVQFSGPVKPLDHLEPAEFVGRLRWLHQGVRPADTVPTRGSYRPPFVPEGGRELNHLERLAQVRRTANRATSRVVALEQEVAQLKKQLAKLTAPKPTFRTRLSRKLRSLLRLDRRQPRPRREPGVDSPA